MGNNKKTSPYRFKPKRKPESIEGKKKYWKQKKQDIILEHNGKNEDPNT